jgi:hypothetical protein
MASNCVIKTDEKKDGLSGTTVWRAQKQGTIRNKNMGRDLFQVHSFPISYFRKKSTYKRISILSSIEL